MKEEHLKLLREQQRDLFFIIVKHFIDIINDFNPNPGDNDKNYWNKYIIERFQDFL